MKKLLLIFTLIYTSNLIGQTFTIHNTGDAPLGLQTLAIDDDNRVWVAKTTAFSGTLDYFHNGEWTILDWEDKNLMSARATDMVVNDGIVEIASYGGTARVDWNSEMFETWDANGSAVQCLEKNTTDDILYIGKDKVYEYADDEWTEISEIRRPSVMAYYEGTNTIWIGTLNYGLYKIEDGEITQYKDELSALSKGILDLDVDSEGNVWMVIDERGLVNFNGDTWTVYNETNSSILNDEPSKLAVDNLDNVWIGGLDYDGLSYFDKSSFTHYEKDLDQIPTDNIRQMRVGRDNDLWMATSLGLIQVSMSAVSTNEAYHGKINSYPNPVANILYIDTKKQDVNFEIYRMDGRKVHQGIFISSIDVSRIDNGVYTIKLINGDNQSLVSRFIKVN